MLTASNGNILEPQECSFIVSGNAKCYSKIEGKDRYFPNTLCHESCIASLIIHTPHHSGPFFTTDEST